MVTKEYFTGIKGAVYIPCRAYNAYQQWRDYSQEVTERDLTYAQSLSINAVRIWVSYEFWKDAPEAFEERFENFLAIASSKNIRVMPSLFECCGREPTEANIIDTDQLKAEAVRSPGTEITNDPSRWKEPMEFVQWILDRYKDDGRLLALEASNEPKSVEDHLFTLEVTKKLKAAGGNVPITIGSQELLDNLAYINFIDIIQWHENFHLSAEKLAVTLGRVQMIQTVVNKPIWVTEWQRFRTGTAAGFAGSKVDKTQVPPNHAPMAKVWQEYGIGTFVWSLMLKPAYLAGSRRHGTFSGIFHEDGAVYSLADARAVAGNEELQFVERHSYPKGFERVAKLGE